MAKNDPSRDKVFGRRAAILGGVQFAMFSAILGRLYYLQVVEGDRYRTLAEENRINLQLLPPPRGQIFDRFGVPLAVNRQNYRVIIVSERARDLDATLDALATIIDLGPEQFERVRTEARRRRGFVPITVRENLSWQDVARIEVNAPDLPGVDIEVGESRFYPHSRATAHVLGYVAPVSADDLRRDAKRDPLLTLPGFRVGRTGLERRLDLPLRGKAGDRQVEVNALGRVIRELDRRAGVLGAQVATTFDIGLQEYVARRVARQSAAVVVLDATNGDVLAMVSSPSFDPNRFNEGLSEAEWQSLRDDERAPLSNKAIAGQFAPGSTFKPAVALAALEHGVVAPGEYVQCTGALEFGEEKFHCWKHDGHGFMNLHEALKQSCDVYFYEIARRLGIERIAAMARRLGLGAPLGLDLPGEQPGLVPDQAWKRGALGSAWVGGETLVTAIGQGYMLSTPLQLAVMTARLVNGGRAVSPRVVRAVGADTATDRPGFPSVGLSDEALRRVRRALDAAVNEPLGTAHAARLTEAGREMGGKTGTAQVTRISLAEREEGIVPNEERPWKLRDHALFVGYAPVADPRYAVAVVVEHGGGGAKAAAPIARDVLAEAQRRNAAGPPSLQIATLPPAAGAGDR